jgi:hypothetical protein
MRHEWLEFGEDALCTLWCRTNENSVTDGSITLRLFNLRSHSSPLTSS